jgi:hypothetical protein
VSSAKTNIFFASSENQERIFIILSKADFQLPFSKFAKIEKIFQIISKALSITGFIFAKNQLKAHFKALNNVVNTNLISFQYLLQKSVIIFIQSITIFFTHTKNSEKSPLHQVNNWLKVFKIISFIIQKAPVTTNTNSFISSLFLSSQFVNSCIQFDILSKKPHFITSQVSETQTIDFNKFPNVSLSVESLPLSVRLCMSIAQATHSIFHIHCKYSHIAPLVFFIVLVCPLKVKLTLSHSLFAFIQNSFNISNSQVIALLYASTI